MSWAIDGQDEILQKCRATREASNRLVDKGGSPAMLAEEVVEVADDSALMKQWAFRIKMAAPSLSIVTGQTEKE